MSGMSRTHGTALDGIAHLQQSIEDILTTPIGSRVMRRDYGFDFDILDQPLNAATRLRLSVRIVQALKRWEPRITISRVRVWLGDSGKTRAEISYRQSDSDTSDTMQIPIGAST